MDGISGTTPEGAFYIFHNISKVLSRTLNKVNVEFKANRKEVQRIRKGEV